MTFTEAAIEVLRREGKPLHFKKIAEIAVRENLLDHVGKIPEEVMGGQLATHCRLPQGDRRVMPVQPGTFALVEWALDEDPTGLDNLITPPPDGEVPYRPKERHPTPSREVARGSGRGEGRGRRREEGEERRPRRYPPPAEVAYEILAGSDRPMSLDDIAAQGAERFLMPDAFVRDSAALAAALSEDNRRRESGGRKPLFALDGEMVSLAAQPEPGERATVALAASRPVAGGDMRRAALLALRRRVRECDGATIEHVAAKLLAAMGLREFKVAKRGRDHVVYTGRRRMGLGEIRHCVRVLRGSGEPTRRDVLETRKDVGNYGAQIGVLLSPGDAARDARAEASAAGQLPVLLLCGEAFAEALTEQGIGCRPIVVPELDEQFFKAATEAAQQEEAARRARREDRERRDGRTADREPQLVRAEKEPREVAPVPPAAPSEERPQVVPTLEVSVEKIEQPLPTPQMRQGGQDEDDDDDESDESEGGESTAQGAPGQQQAGPVEGGEGRRRRRRRRRRGGRGRGRDAAPGASPAEAVQGQPPAASLPDGAPVTPAAPVEVSAPSAPEPGGNGGED